MAFLPDGKMLVTERPAGFASCRPTARSRAGAGLPAVDARGQGGLLDVALDPGFATTASSTGATPSRSEDGTNNTAVGARHVSSTAPRRASRTCR